MARSRLSGFSQEKVVIYCDEEHKDDIPASVGAVQLSGFENLPSPSIFLDDLTSERENIPSSEATTEVNSGLELIPSALALALGNHGGDQPPRYQVKDLQSLLSCGRVSEDLELNNESIEMPGSSCPQPKRLKLKLPEPRGRSKSIETTIQTTPGKKLAKFAFVAGSCSKKDFPKSILRKFDLSRANRAKKTLRFADEVKTEELEQDAASYRREKTEADIKIFHEAYLEIALQGRVNLWECFFCPEWFNNKSEHFEHVLTQHGIDLDSATLITPLYVTGEEQCKETKKVKKFEAFCCPKDRCLYKVVRPLGSEEDFDYISFFEHYASLHPRKTKVSKVKPVRMLRTRIEDMSLEELLEL